MNGHGESYYDNDTSYENYTLFYNDTSTICEDSVYSEADARYTFYLYGVLLNLIGLFGIFGNVISMIILSRPQMRSSINYLLIGLARCDTVLIITSIMLFGLNGITPHTGYLEHYSNHIYPIITPYVYPIAMIAQTVSVYLTLIVTVERFVAVCHPLRVRSLCTYGRARWYVIGVLIFSILYNIPKFFEAKVVYSESKGIYCIDKTEFRESPLYIKIYIHWMYLIFMYIVPFTSLAILNVCIYKQVRRANMERQRLSRIQRREIGLATMLLVVVLVFFVCNFLALVTNTVEILKSNLENFIDTMSILTKISNLLVTVNSSINFVIYAIFGEKFKRLFFKIFCSSRLMKGGRDSPDGATHDDSFASNGDRYSIRLHRQNTKQSKNGSFYDVNNGSTHNSIKLLRGVTSASSVYYPNKSRRNYTTTIKAKPCEYTSTTNI